MRNQLEDSLMDHDRRARSVRSVQSGDDRNEVGNGRGSPTQPIPVVKRWVGGRFRHINAVPTDISGASSILDSPSILSSKELPKSPKPLLQCFSELYTWALITDLGF